MDDGWGRSCGYESIIAGTGDGGCEVLSVRVRGSWLTGGRRERRSGRLVCFGCVACVTCLLLACG